MDFGKKCINCKNFHPANSLDAFGYCALLKPADMPVAPKVHKFFSCDQWEEMPQEQRPAHARRSDFELEREKFFGKTGMEKFLSK